MRFVNCEERNGAPADALHKTAVSKSFRGDIHDSQLSLAHLCDALLLLIQAEGAVDEARRNPAAHQGVYLILHQRNKRRNDESDSRKEQCRQLVAQRFATAGGHDSQHILPRQDAGDDLFLALAKVSETEGFIESLNGFRIHCIRS